MIHCHGWLRLRVSDNALTSEIWECGKGTKHTISYSRLPQLKVLVFGEFVKSHERTKETEGIHYFHLSVIFHGPIPIFIHSVSYYRLILDTRVRPTSRVLCFELLGQNWVQPLPDHGHVRRLLHRRTPIRLTQWSDWLLHFLVRLIEGIWREFKINYVSQRQNHSSKCGTDRRTKRSVYKLTENAENWS